MRAVGRRCHEDAIEPGKENEIVVAIKDLYYAAIEKAERRQVGPHRCSTIRPSWFYSMAAAAATPTRGADFPVLLQVSGAGILETPNLIVTGPTYISDVFTKPSVVRKDLGLEITLHNATKAAMKVQVTNEVIPLKGGPAEKAFPPTIVLIAPGEDDTLNLAEAWPNPKLWWPDDPQMYQVGPAAALRQGARKVID